jgi:hypothetical protein
MRFPRSVPAAAALAVLGAPGLAGGAPTPAKLGTVDELVVTAPTTISELTVTAKIKCLKPDPGGVASARPRIVSIFPRRGATVRPGLVILRVTFDRPMACTGRFAPAPPFANPCGQPVQQMLLSFDRRTVRIPCAVEPGVRYGLGINRNLEGEVFLGLNGLPAEAYDFDFTASAEPATATVCDALLEDAEGVRELARRNGLACPGAKP